MTDDIRERITRLETKFEHISTEIDKISDQVDTLVNLLNQAKGARWVIAGMAALGGFVAAKLGAFLPILPK